MLNVFRQRITVSSAYAKFRCVLAHLRFETRRYWSSKVEDIIRFICIYLELE